VVEEIERTMWCRRLALLATSDEEETKVRFDVLHRGAAKKVRALDDAVGLPRPFDVNLFLDQLERLRGRRIDLHPVADTSGGPCGLWVKEVGRDVIAYAAGTSPLHQSHIILHECGHMIGDHRTGCALNVSEVQQLAPFVRPELIQHMFARSTYNLREEQEAEMIAYLIRLTCSRPRASQLAVCAPSSLDREYDSRVEQIFG